MQTLPAPVAPAAPAALVAPVASVLAWSALGVLAVGVVVAEVVAADTASALAVQYPEFARLQAGLVAAALALGLCVEVVLGITAALVGAIRLGRVLDRWALTLVDALVVALTVGTVLVTAVLFVIPGPPALGLAVLGLAVVGAALVLVVLVLRSLLRQTASMRHGPDAVV
jgi:hypothetical protein